MFLDFPRSSHGPGNSYDAADGSWASQRQISNSYVVGKTAPRLCSDIGEYDPTLSSRNVLCDPPARTKRQKGHQHVLILRQDFSTLPLYHATELGMSYTVATICEQCRIHIDVTVDSTEERLLGSDPCPSGDDNPMHHFVYDASRSRPGTFNIYREERGKDVRVFYCTGKKCPTTVTVSTKSPILHDNWVRLLTNTTILRRRVAEYRRNNGETEHEDSEMLAAVALNTLKSYLSNAIHGDRRPIPRENKRYVMSLSDACADIFKAAHFTSTEVHPPDELQNDPHPAQDEGSWIPPKLEGEGDISEVSRDIQDMFLEVLLLWETASKKTGVRSNITRAETILKQILGCTEYDNIRTMRIDLTQTEPPFYAGLGILPDFSDALGLWAYHRQRERDPENAPYYFECLNGLNSARMSEELQLEVVKLRSQGEFTQAEVINAGKALWIDDIHKADEDHIIGVFHSRLADAPRQEAEMREQLTMIGKYRKSQKILQVAQKAFTDVKRAYQWMGIPESTDDQMLVSAYQVRVGDSPADEATAKQALKSIAEYRQSPLLLSFLETGSVYDAPMDINSAYARLGIDDHTIDDNNLITVFQFRLSDSPDQLNDLRAALRTIGDCRGSEKIIGFLQTGQTEHQSTQGSVESPVGLENIGNTCYLNSLLQYYFTIKPLREMILDIEKYEEAEVTDEVVERKRVGGRKVAKSEIERAKKFVGHLQTLFKDLITARTSAVTPERDLAYLALVSSKDEAERRASISADDNLRPLLDWSDEMDVDTQPPTLISAVDDNASETTLVDEESQGLPLADGEDSIMADAETKITLPENKENMPPLELLDNTIEGAVKHAPLQDVPLNATNDTPPTPPPEPVIPDRPPPPIPPRPKPKAVTTTSMQDDLMFGRQQDVTECIGNVMFQIEAAIKPVKIAEDGEQIDLVKDFFYGTTKQTLAFPNSSETRTKSELFSHLIVNVADGDRDLYSALDSSFDIEQVDLEGRSARRHLSITHLPPILQIQVQRVQFDRIKGSAYKSNAHLSFPPTVFMDRYMDVEDPALDARREESWKWKEELKRYRKRREELTDTPIGEDMATVLDTTRDLLDDLETIDPDLCPPPQLALALEQRSAQIKHELSTLDDRIKSLESRIAQQFTDLRKYGYRIHSVFIHRGSVSFGHYWIYIYDFYKGMFRKYNDQYVDEVRDESEVFTHDGNQPPTPYFLVFVREDQMADITEAVRREIAGSPPPPTIVVD